MEGQAYKGIFLIGPRQFLPTHQTDHYSEMEGKQNFALENILTQIKRLLTDYTDELLQWTEVSQGKETTFDFELDETYQTNIKEVERELTTLKTTMTRDLTNIINWAQDLLLNNKTIFVPPDTKLSSGRNLHSLQKEVETRMEHFPQKTTKEDKLKELMKMAWLYQLSHLEIVSLLTMAFDYQPEDVHCSVYVFLWELKSFIGSRTIEFETIDHLQSDFIDAFGNVMDLTTSLKTLRYFQGWERLKAQKIPSQETENKQNAERNVKVTGNKPKAGPQKAGLTRKLHFTAKPSTEKFVQEVRKLFGSFTDLLPPTYALLSKEERESATTPLDEAYRTRIRNVKQGLHEQIVSLATTLRISENWLVEAMINDNLVFVPHDPRENSGTNLLTLKETIEARVESMSSKYEETDKIKECLKMAVVHRLSHMEIMSLLTMMFPDCPQDRQFSLSSYLWNIKHYSRGQEISFKDIEHYHKDFSFNFDMAMKLAIEQTCLEYYHAMDKIRANEDALNKGTQTEETPQSIDQNQDQDNGKSVDNQDSNSETLAKTTSNNPSRINEETTLAKKTNTQHKKRNRKQKRGKVLVKFGSQLSPQ